MGSSRPHLAPVRYAALALAPLALAACDRQTTSSDPVLEGLPNLTVTEEMRIGSVDDPDVGFSRITDMAVADDGRFFVVDAPELRIRAYSAEGEPLHRFGRRGEGPGEFTWGPRIGVVGDTLWAVEGAPNARITLFRLDGELLQTEVADAVSLPVPTGRGAILPWVMNEDRLFTSQLGYIGFSRDDTAPRVDRLPRVPRVLWNLEGEVVDTIGWDATPPPKMVAPPDYDSPELRFVEISGERRMVPQPLPALADWLHLTDGRIVVDQPPPAGPEAAAVTVTRIGLADDTVYHHELRYVPVAYSDEELDSIAARASRSAGPPLVSAAGASQSVPENADAIAARLRAEMEFPAYRRLIGGPWLADDEAVWLRIHEPDPLASHWILLDPEGRPRGRLELEPGTRPLWSRGDVVWVAEPDDLDVQWLVKYRIAGGA